jgi:predicted permease
VRDFDRDMDDELRAHVEHRADDLVRAGLPRDEALRRARLELGGVDALKERLRGERPLASLRQWPGGALRDLALAARRLRQAPFFAVFAVVSVAVGVSVTTAAYAFMQAALWPPTGVAGETRVAYVVGRDALGGLRWPRLMSRPDFDDLRAAQTSFETLAASASIFYTLSDASVAEAAPGEAVSADYFTALGVAAAAGRLLGSIDDVPDAAPVLVVSERFWRLRLASDPGVVGRAVRYGGQPFHIVGVAAPGFGGLNKLQGAQRRTDVWITLAAARRLSPAAAGAEADRQARRLSVLGRLRDDRPPGAASVELSAIAARLDEAFALRQTAPDGASRTSPRQWAARTLPEDRRLRLGAAGYTGGALVALVALVLIVACTNLANLTLARGTDRLPDVAMRRALGASRARLVRELAAESLLVGAAGGLAALAATRAIVGVVAAGISIRGESLAEMYDPQMDARAMLFAIAAVAVALLVFGLMPALRLTRLDRSPIRAARSGGAGGARWRGQRLLIRVQVAVSTALFLVAALCVAIVAAEAREDPGIDLDRLAMATLAFGGPQWTAERTHAATAAMLDELRREPGIEAAAAAVGLQIAPTYPLWATVNPAGAAPADPARDGRTMYVLPATPGLLETLGVPVMRGRALDHRDGAGAPSTAVVSEEAARQLFGTIEVLGREIVAAGGQTPMPATTFAIVGVAADTETTKLASAREGVVYVSLAQQSRAPVFVLARRRPDLDERAAVTAVRNAVRRAAPDVAIPAGGTGFEILAERLLAARTIGRVAVGLGSCAFLLTVVGLYGVLAHLVARRRREMGVRLALGASPRQLLRLVLGEGLRPVIGGIAIGVGLGLLGRAGAQAALGAGGGAAYESAVIAGVALALAAAGAAACALPAWRAARVDPNEVLKEA